MSGTLLLVWAAIAVIGVISVIIVKVYYSDKETEEIDFSDMTTKNPLQEMVSKENNNKNKKNENTLESLNTNTDYFSKDDKPDITPKNESVQLEEELNPYIVPKTTIEKQSKNISYSSENQVLINYENNVKKFQEPITDTQRDIMSQRNNMNDEEKHELKDLFTIDELIKESKRKDDEREKESKIINKDAPDNSDIKESIKRRQSGEEESLIEEVTDFDDSKKDEADIKQSIEKMHKIADAIKSTGSDDLTPNSTASPKTINEAIDTATSADEKEDEVPIISETKTITDAVINKEEEPAEEEAPKEETTVQETLTPIDDKEEEKTESINDVITKKEDKKPEIKEAALKTPTKVEEDSVSILSGADEDYEFGASIDSSNLFEDENGELSDLDYRKDLAKITNTFKNSSIVKDIREKLSPEKAEPEPDVNEEFIRNVNSYSNDPIYDDYNDYDEYEPIINETHVDYIDETPEDILRQENTRKVFNMAKENAVPEPNNVEPAIPKPKAKPSRTNLKVMINSNEEVLHKGDEIIFKHDGETYSSKVYAINGDDIKVKYRRQNITIKPSDIKKIY